MKTKAQEPVLRIGSPITIGDWKGEVQGFTNDKVAVLLENGRMVWVEHKFIEEHIDDNQG